MSNVRLTWDLPAPTARQRAIDYVRVDIRVDPSLPWTEQTRVLPADIQEVLFADEAPGLHFYQVTVVDVAGVESLPAEVSADVPFDAPAAVVNLLATVEG